MPLRIVLCYPVETRHCQQLKEAAGDAEVVNAGQDGIAREILEADIFIGHAKVPVPWERVVRANRLRWIQSSAAGLDHCLTADVIASDILVTSASGLFADQVAEQTLAMLLAHIRSMPVFFRAQAAKEFIRRPTDDLHGKTVGLVGFGGNGRRIAEVLAPLNVRIIATDMFPDNKPDHVQALMPATQLDQLLEQSDVVVLCVPLNERTRGMINRQSFDKMKQAALLLNVARGPVVDEADLIAALLDDQIRGAALDVTAIEPLAKSSPLWEMPNVIITPHVGAQSARRVDVTTAFACENIRRYLTGKPLLNLVDKQLGFPVPAARQAD